MSRSYETEAIVLRSIRYGEADRVLHLYTEQRGRVGAIAKGVRRSRSRFGGRLEPFFHCELVLHEGRGELATVTAAATVDGHPALRARADSLRAADLAGSALLKLLDGAEANRPAFHLLGSYLTALDRDPAAAGRPTTLAFLLKLLLVSGFAPELGACASCGVGERLVAYSPSAGGVLCESCTDPGFPLAPAALEFLRGALALPLSAAPGGDEHSLGQVQRAIVDTLEHHAQVRLRAVV